MKSSLLLLLLFCALNVSGQIPFPKGFRLIEGDSGSGMDDIYTNGKYSFQTYQITMYEDSIDLAQAFSKQFGFPFRRTKDSLLWGTGRHEGFYSYVVYGGELIELSSRYNDSGFSFYSKWLLYTSRKYQHSGKSFFLFRPR